MRPIVRVKVGTHGVSVTIDVLTDDLPESEPTTTIDLTAHEAARRLGQQTSPEKAEAARRNGKLGGRPRKHAVART